MLSALVVRNMVLIEELSLALGDGMTVLTGETGAGKTLLTGAVSLLAGGTAHPRLVRAGADEAEVEGYFVDAGGNELVVRRVVPRHGRSRAYIDGRLATVNGLSEAVGGLVDICGQHRYGALLRPAVRRGALDRFARADPAPLAEARRRCGELEDRLAAIGGDALARAREVDIVAHQIAELDAARLEDPDEEQRLGAEHRLLSNAAAVRSAAAAAAHLLSSDGPGGTALAEALGHLDPALRVLSEVPPPERHGAGSAGSGGTSPVGPDAGGAHGGGGLLGEVVDRLGVLGEEMSELSARLRRLAEDMHDDPARQADLEERLGLLAGLRRRYGATLSDVMAFGDEVRRRLDELRDAEGTAERLGAELQEARQAVRAESSRLGDQRRRAAPLLAEAVTVELQRLAMPHARLHLDVGTDPGDEVDFLLAVNSGATPAPLAAVASGGELSRAMLALHVVLLEAPPTVVLDEVDAGIGGEAGISVGRALARLGAKRQALVVTHLPQVAAHADAHVSLRKIDDGAAARIEAHPLDPEARLVELARMLSGSPHSGSAQQHAAELLARAGAASGPPKGEPRRPSLL